MTQRIKLDPKAIRAFAEKSNVQGAWLLLVNWMLITVAFALPIIWFNTVSIVISLVLLANRQLGLAILMHECAHYSLFKTHSLNQTLGKALCAAPVLADLDGYRTYHLSHHKRAGTRADPDYGNYKHFPITRRSWLRKTLRDFCGLTGIKLLYATLLMNAGLLTYNMSYQSNRPEQSLPASQIIANLAKSLWLPITVHGMMWSFLAWMGQAWAYLLWWGSYLTIYMFIIRVRNAAEHGAVPDLLDRNPLLHARTTRTSWWERLTFAPNFVNYHLEHHLRPNIPCYNLKAFHQYLSDNGHLNGVNIASGYVDVIKQLSNRNNLAT